MKFETERLIIRPFERDDLDAFYEYAKVPGVGEAAGWPHHKSKDKSLKILENFLSDSTNFAIVLKETNKLIGSIGLNNKINDSMDSWSRYVYLGYVLDKNYWGHGFMTEATAAILHYGFCDLAMDVIFVGHFKENLRSRRVIEKTGFKFVKEDIYHSSSLNKDFEELLYSMTKVDYYEAHHLTLDTRSMKEKMLATDLYSANDKELQELYRASRLKNEAFNSLSIVDEDKSRELLNSWFGAIGQNSFVGKPFRCDYGRNIFIGDSFYANYDCIFLDVAPIHIGNNCFFGPRVSLYTAGHPLDFNIRNSLLEFGKPITIGHNCWFGGNVVVLPGVTIGNNVVVGAGAVISKDIPDNVVVLGNPAHIVKHLD